MTWWRTVMSDGGHLVCVHWRHDRATDASMRTMCANVCPANRLCLCYLATMDTWGRIWWLSLAWWWFSRMALNEFITFFKIYIPVFLWCLNWCYFKIVLDITVFFKKGSWTKKNKLPYNLTSIFLYSITLLVHFKNLGEATTNFNNPHENATNDLENY